MSEEKTLCYVHDPMCSWCWAFRPTLTKVLANLPTDINVKYIVGGLAPDTDTPMDQATQYMIQHHWHTIIQRVPGTPFNFDFWTLNTPKRSTYPACRAVLAAKKQDPTQEDAMILAIQQAYYLQAKNPSEENTLIDCAVAIGLNAKQFKKDLHDPHTQEQLLKDIQQAQTLNVTGFPSLVLLINNQAIPIAIDYIDAKFINAQVNQALNMSY